MIPINLNLSGRLILAPMAGFTDSVFRMICKRFGAAMVFTDLISARAITYKNKKTFEMMEFTEEERPIGIQLCGSDPDVMAEAAVIVAERFHPDVIDLNFGCPVKKVVNKNEGSALLRDIPLMSKIVSRVVNAVNLPVSAKIRSGWDKESENPVSVVNMLESCGVSFVTIHPRTRAQMYKGMANWDWIRQVKENAHIPVIGNGDVLGSQDAARMFQQTGCDAIMIGRGALGNPWIFQDAAMFQHDAVINSLTHQLPNSQQPDAAERLSLAMTHLKQSIEKYGEYSGIRRMRKHLVFYTHNLPRSRELRKHLIASKSMRDVEDVFREYVELMKKSEARSQNSESRSQNCGRIGF
ncbi:MAG: tRNA dihydrouridine synthase DusB [bacterium]|nr:tRNA dihydrouridine synthase DusB [bacterium]